MVIVLVEFPPDGGANVAIGEKTNGDGIRWHGQRYTQAGIYADGITVKVGQLLSELPSGLPGFCITGGLVQFLEPIDGVLDIINLVDRFFFVSNAGVYRGKDQTEVVGPAVVLCCHHCRVGGACGRRMSDSDTGTAHGKGA